jgi:hypothetical protein
MFESSRDAAMRMEGCIFNIGGEPHYFRSFEAWSCIVEDLEDNERRVADVRTIKNLSLDSLPLGYMNYSRNRYESVYLQRKPSRQWKQGIHPSNIHSARRQHSVFEEMRFPCASLYSTLKGQYPTYKAALSTINTILRRNPLGSAAVAFSRTFAVRCKDGGAVLEYKGRVVGELDGEEWELKRGYEYLTEALSEAINENT